MMKKLRLEEGRDRGHPERKSANKQEPFPVNHLSHRFSHSISDPFLFGG
jgi:hypothetical protein